MGVARKTGKIFKKDNKVILRSFDQRVENENKVDGKQGEKKKRTRKNCSKKFKRRSRRCA